VGLTVEVKVRDVFTLKTSKAVYPETLPGSYEATKARKPKLRYLDALNAVLENLQEIALHHLNSLLFGLLNFFLNG
jgi:hypothetical protein